MEFGDFAQLGRTRFPSSTSQVGVPAKRREKEELLPASSFPYKSCDHAIAIENMGRVKEENSLEICL